MKQEFNRTEFTLEATCAFGLEAIVARELKDLGFTDLTNENGCVRFSGDFEAICKANLWLRCADRVRIIMAEFPCDDFEVLFQTVQRIEWENILSLDAYFPVKAKSINSKLHSTPHIQSTVKKAMVERLKSYYDVNWFGEKGATYTIEAAIRNDKARITLDTSGLGLHKRGYREITVTAPIKETLAAAMIYLSRWKADRFLVDPMCGSGTILIEAAQMALNLAPGSNRSFACEEWKYFDLDICKKVREDVLEARKEISFRLQGYDLDRQAVDAARNNAKLAGVEDYIHFQKADLDDFSSPKKYGYMISNPPYGERLNDLKEVEAIEELLKDIMNEYPTWSYYFISSHEEFEENLDRKSSKKRKLYNGRIQCFFYQFFGPRPPRKKQ